MRNNVSPDGKSTFELMYIQLKQYLSFNFEGLYSLQSGPIRFFTISDVAIKVLPAINDTWETHTYSGVSDQLGSLYSSALTFNVRLKQMSDFRRSLVEADKTHFVSESITAWMTSSLTGLVSAKQVKLLFIQQNQRS